jgi:hypothetical protein
LPPEQRPTEFLPLSKQLNKKDEARALVRQLFISSGDIEPNEQAQTLAIKIHRMTTPAHDRALALLLSDLTAEQRRVVAPQRAMLALRRLKCLSASWHRIMAAPAHSSTARPTCWRPQPGAIRPSQSGDIPMSADFAILLVEMQADFIDELPDLNAVALRCNPHH